MVLWNKEIQEIPKQESPLLCANIPHIMCNIYTYMYSGIITYGKENLILNTRDTTEILGNTKEVDFMRIDSGLTNEQNNK